MKISTLRVLDIWIGRPVCWVITTLYFFKRLFVKKIPLANPQKILFIKLFGAGSIVLACPAIMATRKRFPDAQICFLTFDGNQAVLSLMGVIPSENIFTVRDDTLPHLLHDVIVCLTLLIRKKFDVVIDLEFFSRFTAILSFALRAKFRIGFYGFHTEGLRRGRFINYPINYNHTLHTAQAFFTLLRPLGIGQDEYDPTLPIVPCSSGYPKKIQALMQAAGAERIFREVKRWIVINPNSSELISLRKWPAEHFVELACLLRQRLDEFGIIFIGSKTEKSYVDYLLDGLAQRSHAAKTVNLAGLTSIADLLDLFHLADIFITNDSGPAHLAALTKVPTITIFGPETPALYAPLNDNGECVSLGLDCQPCVSVFNGKHSYCKDNQCLKQLTAERLFRATVEMINNTARRNSESLPHRCRQL